MASTRLIVTTSSPWPVLPRGCAGTSGRDLLVRTRKSSPHYCDPGPLRPDGADSACGTYSAFEHSGGQDRVTPQVWLATWGRGLSTRPVSRRGRSAGPVRREADDRLGGHRTLNGGAADLAVALRGVAVAQLQQRPSHGYREEQRRARDQLLAVDVAPAGRARRDRRMPARLMGRQPDRIADSNGLPRGRGYLLDRRLAAADDGGRRACPVGWRPL